MLKFKKAGIFSRSSGETSEPEQQPQGGILAVWGSPGSGKTIVSVKVAQHLASKRQNVVLVLCDMTAPMLPCICPPSELEAERSLGSILAAAHVTEPLVKHNLTTLKKNSCLTILGMKKGENEYSYPPYEQVQALGMVAFSLPYSLELEEQYLAGNLLGELSMKESRSFRKEIEKIVKEVFGC